MKPTFIYTLSKKIAFTAFIVCLLASCTQINVYEKNTGIPAYQWKKANVITGTILITDTTSSYNVYVVLRHTDAYKYNNIWLNIGLQAPGDTMQFVKKNLSLGNDQSGWEGTGMDDIWEIRKLVSANAAFFKKQGEYRFSITQEMRDEPLANVVSAGLRIEKQR